MFDSHTTTSCTAISALCDTLRRITARVNERLGTNFNTILMNVYKDGEDCIGYHRDRETGWAPGTGLGASDLRFKNATGTPAEPGV